MRFILVCFLLMSLSTWAQDSHFEIPTSIKSIINKKLAHHGPNCWGTALYLKGLSPVPRFVSSAEIIYWQSTPLCRPLEENESIQAGDILNVYGPEYIFESDMTLTNAEQFINLFEKDRYKEAKGTSYSGFHRLLHSETFINASQVFGKESPNKNDPFKITKLNEVYGRPRSESECQESPTLAPHLREFDNEPQRIKGSKCDYFSKVYRCQNFKKILTLNSEEEALMEVIRKYQSRIFEAVVSSSKKLSVKEKEEILKFATKTIEKLLSTIQDVKDEQSRMLLSWIYFSAYSLIESLEWIENV